MTTITVGFTCGLRLGSVSWRGAIGHAGLLAAMAGGAAAFWSAAALAVALLMHPVTTLTTLERDGARGVGTVLTVGTRTLTTSAAALLPGGPR